MQNNANMTSDRNMITDKELHYIKDYMSWELLAMKKCNDAAGKCQDMQISQAIRDTGKRHQQRYEAILNHLH